MPNLEPKFIGRGDEQILGRVVVLIDFRENARHSIVGKRNGVAEHEASFLEEAIGVYLYYQGLFLLATDRLARFDTCLSLKNGVKAGTREPTRGVLSFLIAFIEPDPPDQPWTL